MANTTVAATEVEEFCAGLDALAAILRAHPQMGTPTVYGQNGLVSFFTAPELVRAVFDGEWSEPEDLGPAMGGATRVVAVTRRERWYGLAISTAYAVRAAA